MSALTWLLGRCRCGLPGAERLAWGCAEGHTRQVTLCQDHAALTRASIAGGLIACGRCRAGGKERTVGMLAVNGQPARRRWA